MAPPVKESRLGSAYDSSLTQRRRALREITLHTQATTLTLSVFDEDRRLVHGARLQVIQEAGADY